ncbi:response regulator transcription factor [Jidongwangia harbinensis]|uniref:response regulator transcription factor n=1 Tax=Jidongwangia harbinensis TaxID=2878561 RepID=UPI001CD96A2F|nr:response regulator [Jidongwangia harbinensis]MCA2216582.1 response regulator [Jidongwangia harbinensis]
MARLLVVDDERDIRDLVVKRLERDGHQVLAAGGGPEALVVVAEHGLPDAVILDIDMPGMDGFDVLDRLRELGPDMPALFLTVLWSADVAGRARTARVPLVAKPFTAAELAAGVQQLLGRAGTAVAPRTDP